MLLTTPHIAEGADLAAAWAMRREFTLRSDAYLDELLMAQPIGSCWCWADPALSARNLYCPACTAEIKASNR